MKKLITLAVVTVVALTGFPDDVQKLIPLKASEVAKLTPEQQKARRDRMDELLKKHTGGIVRRQGTGKGQIVLISAQDIVALEELAKPFQFLEKRIKVNVAVRKATMDGMPSREKVEKAGASLAVFVVNSAECADAILIAPESRWAQVNVSALSKDSPAPAILAKRARNEVTRALAMLCGAFNSQYPETIMGSVAKPSDLDRFEQVSIPMDVLPKAVEYLRGLGVEPYVQTTYRAACQQGWAPDPQDEFQKAIWDEVHAVPDKPIKIEFDPKKDAPRKDK